MNLVVTDIQRFCLHDGPGIRTVVFLKGCPLRCPWCSNPETQEFGAEPFFNESACLLSKNEECDFCNGIVNTWRKQSQELARFRENLWNLSCPVEAFGVYGYEMSLEDLLEILIKDKVYFDETGGGVTFSGGEPLVHNLKDLLSNLKTYGFHIAVETSLYVSELNLKEVLGFVDLFIVDIKLLTKEDARDVIKGDLDIFLRNMEILKRLYTGEVRYRFPIVPNITDTNKNIDALLQFIKKYNIANIEIFSVHNLGKNKYQALGRSYREFSIATTNDLLRVKNVIETSTKCNVSIMTV